MTSPTYRVLVDWDSDGGLSIGDFETGVNDWTAGAVGTTSPAVAWSTVRSYHGAGALLVTWRAGGTSQQVSAPPMGTFVVGRAYTMSAWVWVPSSGGMHAQCTVAGLSSGSASATTSQWARITHTFTATATTHILQVRAASVPAGGEQTWIDWAQVTGPGEDITATPPGVISDVGIGYGRDQARSLTPVSPGTAEFTVDNVSRDFSPENPTSPLAGLLGPGREMLIEATYSGRVYTLYHGHLDDFDVDSSAGKWVASFSAVDSLARLKDIPASTRMYSAVRTGQAINLLLDAIGWAGDRDIDAGGSTIRWWWLETDDAYQALEDIVATEGPAAFATIGPSGQFIFRDRHHRLIRGASTGVQATFRDTGPLGSTFRAFADTFSRTVSNGWGTADSGPVWATSGGSASDYSVSGGVGRHSHGTVGVARWSSAGSVVDLDITVTLATDTVAVGDSQIVVLAGRYADANNHYQARLDFTPFQQVIVYLVRVVAGVAATLAVKTTSLVHTANTRFALRLQVFGSQLWTKVWLASGAQPTAWDLSATDTALTAAGAIGVGSVLAVGTTNILPVTVTVDDMAEQVFEHDPPFKISYGWRDVVNSVEFTVTDRAPAAKSELIWEDKTPYSMASGQSREIVVTTKDPFWDLQQPSQGPQSTVAVTDPNWVVSGGTVTITFSRTSGQTTTMTVMAVGSVDVLRMRLYARPVTATPSSVKVIREDAASMDLTRGPRAIRPSTTWLNVHDAGAIADLILGQRAKRLPVVTFMITNGSAGQLAQQLSRDLSDRVHVIDSESGFDADCHIERIQHKISDDGNTHETEFACEKIPDLPGNLFRFDVTGAGFNDGVFAQTGRDSPNTVFLFDTTGQGFDNGLFAN